MRLEAHILPKLFLDCHDRQRRQVRPRVLLHLLQQVHAYAHNIDCEHVHLEGKLVDLGWVPE